MTIYEKYAQIRGKIKELQGVVKEMETQIVEEIKDLTAPMKTGYGSFTTRRSQRWTFTSSVNNKVKELEKLQLNIKDLQEEEKKSGKAKVELAEPTLVFTPQKT